MIEVVKRIWLQGLAVLKLIWVKERDQLLLWLVFSIVIPFVIPIGIYLLSRLINDDNRTVKDLFLFLLNHGIYLFWGLSLLFSSIQHIITFKNKLTLAFFLICVIGCLYVIPILFLQCYGLVENHDKTLADNQSANLWTLIIAVVITITAKLGALYIPIANSTSHSPEPNKLLAS